MNTWNDGVEDPFTEPFCAAGATETAAGYARNHVFPDSPELNEPSLDEMSPEALENLWRSARSDAEECEERLIAYLKQEHKQTVERTEQLRMEIKNQDRIMKDMKAQINELRSRQPVAQTVIQRLKKDKEALERDLERSNASAARQNREAHLPPCIRIVKRHLEGDPGYMSVQKDVMLVATHFETLSCETLL